MSDSIQQIEGILLEYYASKGKYARPNDVTHADIDKVRRLANVVANQLTVAMGLRAPAPTNGLVATIQKLDRQVDIYENPELLVCLIPSIQRCPTEYSRK